MANYDRTAHLKSIHEKRKANTLEKVDQAIKILIRANKGINFNSVSEESGVSKASLYNHIDIRERIESLRDQQSKAPSQKQIKRQMNDANKDVLIEALKRKIKELEKENKELREQMKKVYAQVYTKY
jgi:AcrR family transcriptional regulator